MTALVIAEHNNQTLNVATLCAVAAAAKLSGGVDILIAGHQCQAVAELAAQVPGIGKILLADAAHYAHALAENLAPLVLSLSSAYSHLLVAATSNGKNLMPRVAAMLDVAQLSDIIAVVSDDTFVRPIYAGNVLATFQSLDAIKAITVRMTGFDAVPATGGAATIEAVALQADAGLSQFVSEELTKSSRPDLMAADIVVSGGRGVGSAENFALIERLADQLGAAVGASRAAVDAGFVPNDYQVGQTGKCVAPTLYVAVGISGAIQHLAGMKDSKVIVAINKDEEAPIFQVADYGLVGDLFKDVPALCAALEK